MRMLKSLALLLSFSAVPVFADSTTRPTTTTVPAAPSSITLTGYFAPVDAQEVKPKLKRYAGPLVVTQVVTQGKAVKAGQALIAFDLTQLDQEILDATSDVEVAKANQVKSDADAALAVRADAATLDERTDAVADAQRNLAWWRDVEAPDFLKRLDEKVQEAQDKVDDEADELDQLKKMYKSEELTNATADIVVKRAVRELAESKQALEITKRAADQQKATAYQDKNQEFGRILEAAKRGLDDANAGLAQSKVTRAAGVLKAKEGLRDAQKKLSELEEDKAALDLKATKDGIAFLGSFSKGAWQGSTPGAIAVGDKADANKTLITVVRPGALQVIAQLGESDVFRVHSGAKAIVSVAALPELKLAGVLGTRDLTPGAENKFDQTIAVEGVDPRLLPGMKISVEMETK